MPERTNDDADAHPLWRAKCKLGLGAGAAKTGVTNAIAWWIAGRPWHGTHKDDVFLIET